MVRRALVLLTLIAGSVAATADPYRLNGTISYHDGPNCYNATLQGLGFLDRLSFTDNVEMRYFLEKFCRPRIGPLQPGDVMAMVWQGSLIHAALYLGDDKIFEKTSVFGRFGAGFNRALKESVLSIRPLSESEYFSVKGREERCQEFTACPDQQNFTCISVAEFNPRMTRLRSNGDIQRMEVLLLKLQDVALNPKPFDLPDDIQRSLDGLAHRISGLSGRADEDLYIVAIGASVVGALGNLRSEQTFPDQLMEALNNLKGKLRQLRKRILAYDESATTARILAEDSFFIH